MTYSQGSTLRIGRLPVGFRTQEGFLSGTLQNALARPHPLLQGHVGLVDIHGTFYVTRLGNGGGLEALVAVYQLELLTGAGFSQPLRKEWRAFEHLADDGLVLCHRASGRILFAQLPLCEGEYGAVFLFGSHDAEVLSLAANRELLLSGGADGNVRLWNLDNGTMLDSKRHPGGAVQVTAVAFVGPLMVVTGTDRGDVCLYDISTSRILAVQRFHAGDGPITALAPRVTPQQAQGAVLAAAPRGLDGGGVLPGPAGLPWRRTGAERASSDTRLAVASTAGWMQVFWAASNGEDAWQSIHYSAMSGEPLLSYSPDGDYLAVSSGPRMVVLDAATMQTVTEQHFPDGPLVGAGFMPAAAGGSALVAMPRGASLAGGMRLRLYAVPARGLPAPVELTVPLHEDLDSDLGASAVGEEAEVARGEDFLAWMQRMSAAPNASAAPAPSAHEPHPPFTRSPPPSLGREGAPAPAAVASSPRSGPSWGWQAFASVSTSPELRGATPSPPPHVRSGAVNRSPSAEPWASPRPPHPAAAAAAPARLGGAGPPAVPTGVRTAVESQRGASSPGAGAGPTGSPAHHTWQAYRPSTQPAPRSWITGLPPRTDFLPEPMMTSTSPRAAGDVGGQLGPRADISAQPTAALPGPGAPSGLPPYDWSPAAVSVDAALGSVSAVDGNDANAADAGYEPELPHSGTLLPASGIPAAVLGSAGRYPASAALDDVLTDDEGVVADGGGVGAHSKDNKDWCLPEPNGGDDEALPAAPGAKWPGAREYSFAQQAGGQGAWAGAGAAPASWREGDLDMGGDGFSFRFRPPIRPGDAFAVATTLGPRLGANAAPAEPHGREGSFGGRPVPAPTAEVAPNELHDDEDADTDALARTAYFGNALLSLARDESAGGQHASDADNDESGQLWAGEGDPDVWDEAGCRAGEGDLGRPQGGVPRRVVGDGAGASETEFQEPVREELEEEEEEPRGADSLPAPQRPVPGQSPRHPQPCDPASGPPTNRGEGDPSVGTLAARDDSEHWAQLPAVSRSVAADSQGGSGAGGVWGGWANEDLLGGVGAATQAAEAEAQHSGAADLKAPSARSQPAPRPPPALSSHRLELSLAAAGGNHPVGPRLGPSKATPGHVERHARLQGSADAEQGRQPLSGASLMATDGPVSRDGRPRATALPAGTQRSPAALQSRGFKPPHHAKGMQQLRRRQGPSPGLASRQEQTGMLADAEGNAATPAADVLASGGQSPVRSSLLSPVVLLGSPSTSTSTYAPVRGSQPVAVSRRQKAEPAVAAAAVVGGVRHGSRQQLQHLRQLRQQQHQLRRGKEPFSASSETAGGLHPKPPYDDGFAVTNDHQARQQTPQHTPAASTVPSRPGTPSGVYKIQASGGEDCEPDEPVQAPDSYDVPKLGSTVLLLKKMQALEQVLAKPLAGARGVAAAKAPPGRGLGRAAGGDSHAAGVPAAILKEYVSEAQREEATRRAATTAANVPPGVKLYHDLPSVDYEEQQPASRVPKQLHPGWVASRQLKPELCSLWRPSEYATEVCNTRGVALYTPPSSVEVAANVLALQWLC